jgi:formylglycine-generating enzyme required for sulfatase activity
LTLQEFLTAAAIVDRETDYAEAIKKYWDDERYQEVIELYVGYLSIDNKRWANKIVEGTLKEQDRPPFHRWRLAARALLDMHQDRRGFEVIDLATEKPRFIIGADASVRDRADAGELLGWLGDRRDLEQFIALENGVYRTSQGEVKIDSFEIEAFPVTNQVFAKFVNAGGYTTEDFWTVEGRKWLDYTEAKYPRFWQERRWNCPNAPVVGVSWYEADAFARWLTQSRADGWIYRLPDEKEWEATAAGFDRREYPWGKEWSEDRCNTEESGIGKTSPVGVFQNGATPEGIFDLSGNVWEWTCLNYHAGKVSGDFDFDPELQKLLDEKKIDKYPEKIKEKDRQLPVLRGGSWLNDRAYARCAARHFYFHPNSRYDCLGFRCART